MNDETPVCVEMAHQIIEQLSEMYFQLGLPEARDFVVEVFRPMLETQPDPNDIEDQFEDAEITNLDMMKLSCAYVIGAVNAESAGDREMAWLGVSHAQYWMGLANGLGFMKGAARTALIGRSQAGGKNRDTKAYGHVREFARQLAQKHLDGSAANAARNIKDAVVAFQLKNNPHYALSEIAPELKIAEWLKGLPFTGKRSPRKPNVKN
jgi:hypothetical protein